MLPIPVISVCIANYNGMEVIDDCLRSVLEQTGNFQVEILVHDDASTDGSVDHLRANYPQTKLLCSEANVGFCIANNRMAAAAQGDYLLLLNNDAALFPDALHTLLTEAEQLVRPTILTLPQYDANSGDLVDRGCLLDPFYNTVPNLNPARQDVAMVIGACLWIPHSLWLELGGFPEWFGSIAEDLYLCCRARLAGYAVRALNASGYRHWQGKSFGGGKVTPEKRLVTSRRRRAQSELNKSFVIACTYPCWILMILFPLHLSLLLFEGIMLTFVKWDFDLWRRIYAPLLPSIWRSREDLFLLRQQIQSQRRIGLKSWGAVFRWTPYKLQMLLKYGLPDVR